jgi:hypothetical protein
MFQRHGMICFLFFVSGCATASEPPAKQIAAPDSAWTTTYVETASSKSAASVEQGSRHSSVPKRVERRSVSQDPSTNQAPTHDDAAVIRYVLTESRSRYPGNCACPDDRDRAGKRCGGRSAYSRRGGYAPLCYPHDVTPEMIEMARNEAL